MGCADDVAELVGLLEEVGADGFNGDTMFGGNNSFYDRSAKSGDHKPIAFQPECGEDNRALLDAAGARQSDTGDASHSPEAGIFAVFQRLFTALSLLFTARPHCNAPSHVLHIETLAKTRGAPRGAGSSMTVPGHGAGYTLAANPLSWNYWVSATALFWRRKHCFRARMLPFLAV